MNTTEISSGLNWTSIFKAFHRTQMRLRRDRFKLTMTPRVAPAAHSGRPYKVALWRLLNNHVAKPAA